VRSYAEPLLVIVMVASYVSPVLPEGAVTDIRSLSRIDSSA
jgi:hypothetical protein